MGRIEFADYRFVQSAREHDLGMLSLEPSMADPLAAWHTDHVNFTRLLDILEEQVAAFHAGAHPDYDLMVDIANYLRHYPDRFHHPREDVAFARLAERDPALQLPIARRMQEHRILAAAGDTLLGHLHDIIEGAFVERSTLESAAGTYLVYYRHHLAAEEQEVIPRAGRLLTPEDWAAVAAAVPAGPDPLFGNDSEARYRELRREIALEARERNVE
jgi:hemerythrin-like domain-containing protein